jgi:hypothetical protein
MGKYLFYKEKSWEGSIQGYYFSSMVKVSPVKVFMVELQYVREQDSPEARDRFHQRSTRSFYVYKFCVQLFCAYGLGLTLLVQDCWRKCCV